MSDKKNTLKDALKPKNAVKSSNGKGPAFYNREKTNCILDMVTHDDPAVRIAVLSSTNIPTKVLSEALKIEQDHRVLRTIMLNEKLPRKAASEFVDADNDPRVDAFEGDEEVIARFQQ